MGQLSAVWSGLPGATAFLLDHRRLARCDHGLRVKIKRPTHTIGKHDRSVCREIENWSSMAIRRLSIRLVSVYRLTV